MWGNETSAITFFHSAFCKIFACTKQFIYDEISFCAHFLNSGFCINPARDSSGILLVHVFMRLSFRSSLQASHSPLVLGLVSCLLCIVVSAGMFVLRHDRNADIVSSTYSLASGQSHAFSLPLQLAQTDVRTVQVHIAFVAPSAATSRYHMVWYGCAERLTLNGTEVIVADGNRCDSARGVVVELAPALRAGANTLELTLAAHATRPEFLAFMSLRPSVQNRETTLHIGLFLAMLLLIGGLGVAAVFRSWQRGCWLGCVFLCGAALRVLLSVATPVGLRTSDIDGHLDYVRRVAEYFVIPLAQSGWETYQPPLFYFAAGAWMRAVAFIRFAAEMSVADVQVLALLFSMVTLGIGVWIVHVLLPDSPGRRQEALVCSMLFAAAPGLVLFAPNVSNDSLLTLLAFLFFAALLQWYRYAQMRWWLAVCVVVSLGVLTKSNALVWIGIALAAAAWRPGSSCRTKLALATQLFGVLLALCGWYFVLRYIIQGERTLIGNVHLLPEAYRVPNTLQYLLGFHPLRVFAHPFIQNGDASAGWMHLTEYLFTSAHFGGFSYPEAVMWIAQWVLVGGMFSMALAAYAVVRGRLSGIHPVAGIACALLLFSQLAYRILYPFSYNQDARFSPLLVLLAAYCCVWSLRHVPPRFRSVCEAALLAYALCCAAFSVLLFLQY